ncbi:hypothetical protein AJ85_04115 [Alkalihalobacillus alcalophilus ATCC 27647 = CGMCC 1.3604]|uniref:Uncharacterized protein n=1 Tax=Alkalihalobacillus alcalophilus ATCC 27647 = CGMCC 1.3604 TaxID=1218173 RepID=A0A4S4K219_ALKAL|nr:hypothetical protein AJ85_04115 [Alkalihalobacillus alcalophilus ATCC 27647 = CGMCC 1.3604]
MTIRFERVWLEQNEGNVVLAFLRFILAFKQRKKRMPYRIRSQERGEDD